MKIVVLDGYPGNPGDLSWEPVEKRGCLTVYDRSASQEIVSRCHNAQVVLINKCPLRREHIEALPNLKYIGIIATGFDPVDLDAAAERHIMVTNVPDYSSNHVVQLTFALLLELFDRVGLHDRAVKDGQWANCPDFTFQLKQLGELAGRTMGIIGYGSIGRKVAAVAQAFGMKVLASARRHREEPGVSFLPVHDVFAQSDVISLHCPLNEASYHLVNRETLALMKRGSWLLNTARGPLVDEEALLEALQSGQLAGAGLDVLSQEPPRDGNKLIEHPAVIVTPHIAWSSFEARQRLMNQCAANLEAWIKGEPVNVVQLPK